MLIISNILQFKTKDVENGRKPKEFIMLNEKKTGKAKKFPITKNLNKVILQFMKEYDLEREEYLFQSRKENNKPITRQHAAIY